jgi:rhodanese-related sulfurtransferase
MEDKQIALNGVVASLGTSKFEAPEVSIADIKANPEKYVLLDVRSEEERAVSTIPGSINKAQFEEDTAKYADKEVVCFCTVGYISAGATCKFSATSSSATSAT